MANSPFINLLFRLFTYKSLQSYDFFFTYANKNGKIF